SGHSAQERSDIYEPACTVPLSSLERERHTGRWHATRASSYEGPHIRLCYPIPHHVTRIDVSTFAHSRFRKGQVGDAVRNQINLFCWNSKYILQKPGRVLAHTIRRSERAAISCKTISWSMSGSQRTVCRVVTTGILRCCSSRKTWLPAFPP